VCLAADPGRLAALRGELRERFRASPLHDSRGLARDIEAAYRTMWQRWCAARP
jgi:protein O-GlcNAc transferase